MYRDSLPKTEHFIRLIDSSGPKECSAVSLISNCAFSCPKSQISIVSLLTGLSLLHPEHKPIPIIGYAFTQIEKTPSQYQNEKAVNRLLDLVGSKIKNFNDFL